MEDVLFLIKHWDYIKKSHWFCLFPTFEFQKSRGWRRHCGRCLAPISNLNQVRVLLWLVVGYTNLIFIFIFIIYFIDVLWYHNHACGLVDEGVDPSMTPRLGVRPQRMHPNHFILLCVVLFIYFSILIYFLLRSFFCKYVEHKPPLFLSLEFNDGLFYFI